jgi:hypothetical protein
MFLSIILFSVVIIFLLILFVLSYVLNSFKPYEPVAPTPPQILPNALWGWPQIDSDGNFIKDSAGNIVYNENLSFVPVSGPNGKCKGLFWKATSKYSPGFPLLRQVGDCIDGTIPNCEPYPGKIIGCVDSDELNVQQLQRMCRGVIGYGISNTGVCVGVDGTIYKKDETEVYWSLCTSSDSPPPCEQDLSLMMINVGLPGGGVLDGASAFFVDNYVEGPPETYTINSSTPDFTNMDNGISTQLFRITNGSVNSDGNVSPSQEGVFIQIIHRMSGKYLAPTLTGKNILTPQETNLMLYGPDEYVVPSDFLDPRGWWWAQIPETTFKLQNSSLYVVGGPFLAISSDSFVAPSAVYVTIPQCIVYTPQPSQFPPFGSVNFTAIANYIINANPLVLYLGPVDQLVYMGPFKVGIQIKTPTDTSTLIPLDSKPLAWKTYSLSIIPLLLNDFNTYST